MNKIRDLIYPRDLSHVGSAANFEKLSSRPELHYMLQFSKDRNNIPPPPAPDLHGPPSSTVDFFWKVVDLEWSVSAERADLRSRKTLHLRGSYSDQQPKCSTVESSHG